MTPEQREAIEASIKASSQDAEALCARHSPEQLLRRPSESAWSAAECLVHLNLTAAATLPLVEEAVARARAKGARSGRASRMDWMGRLLAWALTPGRFASKTAAPFQPVGVASPSKALAEFMQWQDRLVAALRAAEGLDLSAVKIASPFNPRVRYNAYAAFVVLDTHTRRHLRQARRAAASSQ